jgi:hypothetical protein
MKFAILATAIAGLTFALPAAAQRVPDTPAVGTKSSSAATGFVSPNGMVNGSTSVANGELALGATVYGAARAPRDAYALNSPVYVPDREENVIIADD